MPAGNAQNIRSLLKQISIEDDETVLRVCNEALKRSKTDLHAQHTKVVALLRLDRYEDALRALDEYGDDMKRKASLGYSYALYKRGQLREAVEVAKYAAASASEDDERRGALHVQAQASYRAEDFANAATIYQGLFESPRALGNEYNDLRINSWASEAQRLWQRERDSARARKPEREDLETFETCYNVACASLARGDLKQGEILLRRAKELCKTAEDLPEDLKESELLPINIQQLYALISQGKTEEAEELVKEISVDDIPEISVKRIAQNNILITQHLNTNPYILYKTFHDAPEPEGNDQFFKFQSEALEANSHALDLEVQKYDGVIRSTTKALAQRPYPSTEPNDNLLSIYNAAARVRGQTNRKSIQELRSLLDRRPKDIGLVLTIVQLIVGEGNTTSAIDVLESSLRSLEESISEADQEVRYNPGLLSVLIALYQREGRKSHIKSELAKAALFWRQQTQQPPSLLRAAAASLLHSSDPADLAISQGLFSTLRNNNPGDKFALAGYVASYATSDLEKVKKELDILPRSQDLVSDIDAAALESAGVPQSQASLAANAAAIAGARKRASKEQQHARAKKRIRKSRLPKDYDASKTPDAERWLPLRDRSSYRPKGKKGKQRAAERTQGGIVSEDVSAKPQQPQPQQKTAASKKKGKR
ncbi:hypothetical protein UA08_05957 [Talaromyces atroroseus]|uniref:Signal recognition particle subunit SRP72 n=1 Tax=Talaromyces atroroseus TaxID=1441469 RepID=A0A225ALG0_TALAT|nr:hypothetical protein UA08_05957 [Talaromyces atroroseus]OKL59154.1 hypothetical protein UA08_05957 [Talaromyces atroroseus]